MQNFFNLAGEEGNSSIDVRHNLTGNWVAELPFGPNRRFFNKGGVMAKVLDGFLVSGTFTFASGNYFTPTYSDGVAEANSGNTYTQRPNRNYNASSKGPGTVQQFFNRGAFTAPTALNGITQFGTAAVGSIERAGSRRCERFAFSDGAVLGDELVRGARDGEQCLQYGAVQRY